MNKAWWLPLLLIGCGGRPAALDRGFGSTQTVGLDSSVAVLDPGLDRVLMLSSMIPGEVIEYLDTGKILAKGIDDEDVMFARPGPAVEYWEGED